MSHFLHLPGNIDYDTGMKYKPALPRPHSSPMGITTTEPPVSRGSWQGGGVGSAELSSSSSTQRGIKHPSITPGITILADPPHVTPRNTDENVL